MATAYEEFLKTKLLVAPSVGIEVGDLNRNLFPFQSDIVRWALRKGRAALFADCGLGKSLCQLEWANRVHYDGASQGGHVLILAPLAVAEQTVREGVKFGIKVNHIKDGSDVHGDTGIWITNYEKLHRFDPSIFRGVVLDESSVLKAYDGKTRTEIIESFSQTPYRLACTATPAPNDHMELGNHSEFLGVMTRAEMLAMFFIHDGGETQKWRLKGHGKQAFWKWICSWAVSLRKPSDLGYDDAGFDLPPLNVQHRVIADNVETAHARGLLVNIEARTLEERRGARKASLGGRVEECALLANVDKEQWLIWCNLNAEGDALEKAIPDSVQVSGADSEEQKTDRMLGFASGKYRVLISKSSICGFGMNWQNCHNVSFCGLSDSFEQYYQAVRRCWRFGQSKAVSCHIVTSAAEGAVVANVKRKEEEAREMSEEMIKNMTTDSSVAVKQTSRDSAAYAPEKVSGKGWDLYLGDCVDVTRSLADDSVHYTVFSPPFASLYTYNNSERDMGNVRTHAEFYEHFRFLVPELYRATMPGRLLSFHCMNLPTSKSRDGVIGLTDFRGLLIRMFEECGWIYHSEVCIWKDPVTAMQRTKALGLLHKQIKKDSCMSRQGIADYLVTMRKPGDNPERVTHTNDDFPVQLWQKYASPVWMDIDPSDTLQYRTAREDDDERHICPLQLQVIERALKLWSNPGDLVLSPFTGIGSEGYVALTEGRRFVGSELKRSYWELARRNLASAEPNAKGQQRSLFDEATP